MLGSSPSFFLSLKEVIIIYDEFPSLYKNYNSGYTKSQEKFRIKVQINFNAKEHEKILLVKKMEYTKILKRLREENHMTQQEVASILEITRGLYAQYEIADKIIPIAHLNTLSNLFHVTIDYILGLSSDRIYPMIISNINKEKLGTRLKELRKENKLTQKKLAQQLNTSHSVISAYESGKTMILTSFLYEICQKYHISADYLLGKIDEKPNLN